MSQGFVSSFCSGHISKKRKSGRAELDPDSLPVVGFGCVEEWCRNNGLGVIHGGHNALRFTPHFAITSLEIDLIINLVRKALIHFSSEAIVEAEASA